MATLRIAPPPPEVATVYLHRPATDSEVVPTEFIRPLPPSPDSALSGRHRWVIIRICECIVATGDESLQLLLDQLNYKLAQLRSYLLDPGFAGYIEGFNRLPNPETKKPPFNPPTELLLVLLGATPGVALDADVYLDPDKYPRPPPAWLTAVPSLRYSSWQEVLERVATWSNATPDSATSTCDVVEAALHLLRGSVIFSTEGQIDLHEYGSSIVLTQYRQPTNGLWVTTEMRNVKDYRHRALPYPHNNEPLTKTIRDGYTWSEGNAQITCIEDLALPQVAVKLLTTSRLNSHSDPLNTFDQIKRSGLKRVRYVFRTKDATARTYFWHLAQSGSAVGDLSTLLDEIQTYFLVNGKAKPHTTHLGHEPIAVIKINTVFLILDVVELAPAGQHWRYPRTARSLHTGVAFADNVDSYRHPGVLLTINVVLAKPNVPAVAVAPPLRLRVRDAPPDLRKNSALDDDLPDSRSNNDVATFLDWTIPARSTPALAPWISAVILNRLRAVMVARTYLGLPHDIEAWFQNHSRYPSELLSDATGIVIRQIPATDGTPTFDAMFDTNDRFKLAPKRYPPIALFPGLLERRPLVGSNGSINLAWLREVYTSVVEATKGIDPLSLAEGELWQLYASDFVSRKVFTTKLQWFYWRVNRLGEVNKRTLAAPLYTPAGNIAKNLFSSVALNDRKLTQEIRDYDHLAHNLPPENDGRLIVPAHEPRPAPPPRPEPFVAVAAVPPTSPAPPATTTLPVTVLPPTSGDVDPRVADAIAVRKQALNDVVALYSQYLRAYNDLERRHGPEPKLESEFGRVRRNMDTLGSTWNGPSGTATPEESIRITTEALDDSRRALKVVGDTTTMVTRLDTDAQSIYNSGLQDPAYIDERYKSLKEAYDGAATTVEGVSVSWENLSEAMKHPRQVRTIDTLLSSAKRVVSSTDRSALENLAHGWRTQIASTLDEYDKVSSIHKRGNPYGEALVARIEQSLGTTRTPPMTYPASWPVDSSSYNALEQLKNNSERWKNGVRDQLSLILGQVISRYMATRGTLLERLGRAADPANPSDNLLARSKASLFSERTDPPYIERLVLGIVASPDAVTKFLVDAIAEKPSDTKSIFDRIRTKYLDCAIMAAVADPLESGGQGGAAWNNLQRVFIAIKTRARRVEDYFAAFVDSLASETGWCAYAHKRHWSYTPTDPANYELIDGETFQWRSFTGWANPNKSKSSDESTQVSNGELLVLKGIEKLWADMWSAAMTAVPLTATHSIPSPELRFVQLGNTLEECWKRLENDNRLYGSIITHLLPVTGNITTPMSAYQLFVRVTVGLLGGRDIPQPGNPLGGIDYRAIEANALDRIDQAERAVLKVMLDGLNKLTIWPSASVTPSNWWHGNNTAYLAYEFTRPNALLTPRPDGPEDDFHGMTIALCEFLAFGRPGLWERYNDLRSGDKSDSRAAPVSRPTSAVIAQFAIAARARRYRSATRVGDAAAFGKWISRLWTDSELARVIGMARTFGRMVADTSTPSGLLLSRELSPNHFEDGWDLFERRTPINPGDINNEGYELIRALAIETGLLVYGATVATAGLSAVALRDRRAKGPLVDALYALLRCLTTGSLGDPTPATTSSVVNLLAQWVFQTSTAASARALPNPASPAQWVHLLGLLLHEEFAPPGTIGASVSAAARLDALTTSAERTLPTLVSVIEGQPEGSTGTRFLPHPRTKLLYDAGAFDNQRTMSAGEEALYRVAWPLALGQVVRNSYKRVAPDDTTKPPASEVLSFLYSTLLRNDTRSEDPIPFFVATLPDNPGQLRYSGFSAQAAADYCASSRFQIELDVIDPTMMYGLGELERLSDPQNIADDRETGQRLAATRLLLNNHGTRNRLLVHIDTEVTKGNSAAFTGLWSRERQHYATERGIFSLMRRSSSSALIRESIQNRWLMLSGWGLEQSAALPADGSLLITLEPVSYGSGIDALPATTQQRLYVNPLYPVTGSSLRPPSTGAYTGWLRPESAIGYGTKRLDVDMGWPQLVELCKYATIMSEKSAIVDWYQRLLKLDQARRQRSNYVAVLNGDGSLSYALQRSLSVDAVTDSRLDDAMEELKRKWARFLWAAKELFERMRPTLGIPPAQFDAYAEAHVDLLEAWKIEWEIKMLTAYSKARVKIVKAISKRISAADIRANIDKVIAQFIDADKVESRKRDGWLATLVGINDEVGARQLRERVVAKNKVLHSVRET